MKKFAVWIMMCSFLLMVISTSGCSYGTAYTKYAEAQTAMASSAGAQLVTIGTDGRVTGIGNPMIAMAMMNMKAPKDGWESFFDFLKFATPFAAIYGVVGAMSSAVHGNTTNVSGNNNLMNNNTGSGSSFASPVTTTTTTTEVGISGGEGSIGQ